MIVQHKQYMQSQFGKFNDLFFPLVAIEKKLGVVELFGNAGYAVCADDVVRRHFAAKLQRSVFDVRRWRYIAGWRRAARVRVIVRYDKSAARLVEHKFRYLSEIYLNIAVCALRDQPTVL